MTKKQLFTNALELKAKDRAMLAEELWFSLDHTTKEQVQDAWTVELRRRMDRLERGEVETIPSDQVMREARKLVRKKRTA